jgi:hypothetical protein
MARLLMLAALVAACGGQAVTPAPAPTTTPTPNPAPATEQKVLVLPAPVAQLEPGTYSKAGFTPRVTFTVGDGWTAAQATAGFFDIQDEPGSLDVVAVQFGNVVGAEDAQSAAEAVADRDGLKSGDIEAVEIDGYHGFRMTVETTDPLDTQPPVFHPVIRLTPGDVSIASARRLQLTLLDVDGDVLAIMVGGSIADWNHAIAISTPVIESVQIGADNSVS